MKHPPQWLILAMRWGGVAVGVVALATLAYVVWSHYQESFWAWPREVKWAAAAALALLLAASRMRFIASRLEARALVNPKPEKDASDGQLHPNLRIYEARRPSTGGAIPTVSHGPTAAAATEPEFAVQLRKLHELKEAGIITEPEFEAKKAAILEKIG